MILRALFILGVSWALALPGFGNSSFWVRIATTRRDFSSGGLFLRSKRFFGVCEDLPHAFRQDGGVRAIQYPVIECGRDVHHLAWDDFSIFDDGLVLDRTHCDNHRDARVGHEWRIRLVQTE